MEVEEDGLMGGPDGGSVKKFAWCTDIHLDFIDGPDDVGRVVDEFAEPLSKIDCDGVIISGDISLAQHIIRHLKILDRVIDKKVYFVLGNHDFYGGSFDDVRSEVAALCAGSNSLRYLTGAAPISLTPSTAIVGDDGWYDARYGDASTSPYVMTDWFRIFDYINAGAMRPGAWGARPDMGTVIALSRKFADAAAQRLLDAMRSAATSHQRVIVVTHIPPWTKVHRHDGKAATPASHPWYTSAATGRAIEMAAEEFSNVAFEVYCGHTHGRYDSRISKNVTCHVGGADYGMPAVTGFIGVE
jgi:predicted phosphohydrolase